MTIEPKISVTHDRGNAFEVRSVVLYCHRVNVQGVCDKRQGKRTFEVGGVVAHCQLPDMRIHRNGFVLVQRKQTHASCNLQCMMGFFTLRVIQYCM